jgi:hypothetical protein
MQRQANIQKTVWLCVQLLFFTFMSWGTGAQAQASLILYDDALASGWQNWSWSTTVNLNATAQRQSGSRAIAATYTGGWAGVYLRSSAALADGYTTLRFWAHGGTSGGQQIRVVFYDQAGGSTAGATITLQAATWTQHDVSLGDFGQSSRLWGVVWQENTGSAKPIFYLDTIQLIGASGGTPTPPSQGPALRIDAAADHRAISPNIYGMAFASSALAADLRLPVNRWGGNATTRYNYRLDVSNRAADWFFQNIPNAVASVAQLPRGSAADAFVQANRATSTDTLMVMPLIGWTPRSRTYAECGFSVQRYGAQQQVDQWYPDCGNGVRPNGTYVTGNNPLDTSIAIDETWVQDWIRHLIGEFGTAANGGVRYYSLDNEPSLWNHTHRDVRPLPLGSIELRDLTYRYGAAIKAVDPAAQLFGPVEWGWTAYFYSAVDSASGQWANPPEASIRGGLPLAPWYLDQMRRYEQQNGQRLLDFFTLHYYPQAAGVALGSAGDAATQARRLRSTRSLWDPTYVDESWIGDPVRLLPRMREWVDQYYPGTQLAITEYNFGGFEHINGALTQADVLGIFGREGLDFATLWTSPAFNEPVAFAYRMYRNYDGSGNSFGETRVRAQSDDQSRLSTYAATRADGALTIMIINKTSTPLNAPLQIANFSGSSAQVYRYSTGDWTRIIREADITLSGSATLSFPASSITLLVIAPGSQNATLNGTIALQGRPSGALPVQVTINSAAPQALTTSTTGAFTLTGLPPGTHDIRIKHAQSLAVVQRVMLVGGVNAVQFGTLLTGDTNDDNAVTLQDFSIMAASFNRTSGQTGFDARADLNGDGAVTLQDFSFLAGNFNRVGQ